MHSCWVILFLPEKVKKRPSPGDETTVKFHSLHACISFQPAAISTADRSLPVSGQFCRNKIHSIKGKQFQGEEANISRKALDERGIIGILVLNNEERNGASLWSGMTANKHRNLTVLLGSGANSVISSENVASWPIVLNPVPHYCWRLSGKEWKSTIFSSPCKCFPHFLKKKLDQSACCGKSAGLSWFCSKCILLSVSKEASHIG